MLHKQADLNITSIEDVSTEGIFLRLPLLASSNAALFSALVSLNEILFWTKVPIVVSIILQINIQMKFPYSLFYKVEFRNKGFDSVEQKGGISQLKNNRMMARIIRQIPAIIKIAIPTRQIRDRINANINLIIYNFVLNSTSNIIEIYL